MQGSKHRCRDGVCKAGADCISIFFLQIFPTAKEKKINIKMSEQTI